jgi:hypothetical protein
MGEVAAVAEPSPQAALVARRPPGPAAEPCRSPKRMRRRLGYRGPHLRTADVTNSTVDVTRRGCACSWVRRDLACQSWSVMRNPTHRVRLRVARTDGVKPANFRERHHATLRRRLDATRRGRVLLEGEMGLEGTDTDSHCVLPTGTTLLLSGWWEPRAKHDSILVLVA